MLDDEEKTTNFFIEEQLTGKVPYFGASVFGSNKFLVFINRVDTINLSNGDIYDKFIPYSTSGISEFNEINKVSVYPNPFSSETTIQPTDILNDAMLTVYNSFGQTVKQISIQQFLSQ